MTSAPSPPPNPSAPDSIAGFKILVVEDDPTSRLVLARMVQALGYAVDTAVDGADALEKLDAGNHDIVLTDLAMPRMTGFELTETLRARQSKRWLPIVVTTGVQDRGAEARLLEVGADGLLHKPISREMLRSVLRNLTRTLRLQREVALQLRSFRSAADSLVDGVICIDREGTIVIANQAIELIFGYPNPELIGRNVRQLMPEPIRSDHDGYLARYRETGEKSVIGAIRRVLGQHRDGTIFPIELRVTEDQSETSHFRYIGVIRTLDEQERLERLRRDFISVVNHELRTPLTSIDGALKLLGTRIGGDLSEKGKHLVSVASRNADRLRRLIDEILDLERIESGDWRLTLAPARLDLALAEAIETNQQFARLKGVSLHQARSTTCSAAIDPDRFQQVMSNLISNAAKHSVDGGQVDIELMREANQARISVTNYGSPIPHELRSRLFERFAQAQDVDRRTREGTGLGLAITRGIVEGLGGSIGYTSDEARTCFFFTLPITEPAADEADSEDSA